MFSSLTRIVIPSMEARSRVKYKLASANLGEFGGDGCPFA